MLVVFDSTKPAGAAIFAVFAREPIAAGASVPTTVNVALPPAGSVTLAASEPEPEGGHVAPLDPAHVHVAFNTDASNVSVTAAPTAVAGPVFVAVIVHVVCPPGATEFAPLVFVIDKSPPAAIGSASLAELLVAFGSLLPPGGVTDAVFVKDPDAPGSRRPTRVNVAVPPGARSTVEAMDPLPAALSQFDPDDATQVQVTDPSMAGTASFTCALFTATLVEVFCTMMV